MPRQRHRAAGAGPVAVAVAVAVAQPTSSTDGEQPVRVCGGARGGARGACAAAELNECHCYISELEQQRTELQKRYEDIYQSKEHLSKLFQSLNSGSDAAQSRFVEEKRQWNEDRLQMLEELATHRGRAEQLKLELEAKAARSPSGSRDARPEEEEEQVEAEAEAQHVVRQRQHSQSQVALHKLRHKLAAYKTRDEVNKQLRENWAKQLNQMEQAVLLANEIYNRERTRHEAEIAEKDVEILKLRKFLLSFTQRSQKRYRPKRKIVKPKVIKAEHKSDD